MLQTYMLVVPLHIRQHVILAVARFAAQATGMAIISIFHEPLSAHTCFMAQYEAHICAAHAIVRLTETIAIDS